jgi:hypothetical protein
LLFGLACIAASAAPASADIAAFNAAVKVGDYRAASAAAAQTWPTLDKAAPDIAIVAREFAWASMLAGDPRGAQVYSSFLVTTPPATAPKEYLPVVGKVLDAWAKFAVSSTSETRTALNNALIDRAAIAATDLISVRAAQALFYDDWDKGRWKEASAVGWSASAILRNYGKGLADAAYSLEMGTLAARFADQPTGQLAISLRQLSERVLTDALATTEPLLKERLAHVFYNTNAWAVVAERMMAQQDKRFQPAPRSDNLRRASRLLSPAPGDPALPECAVAREASSKQPEYPTGTTFKDWPGFATYRLTLSGNSRFSEIRLMGAAPHSDFAQAVDKVTEDWRWTFRDAVRPPQCRMPEYYFVEFEFRLGD